MDNFILFILASVTAGEVWNNAGYFSDWIKNRNDPNWKGFDTKALRNDLLLGLFLGLGIIVYSSVVAGTANAITIPPITSAQTFISAVAGLFGIVAVVDKFVVGGIGRAVTLRKPKAPKEI